MYPEWNVWRNDDSRVTIGDSSNFLENPLCKDYGDTYIHDTGWYECNQEGSVVTIYRKPFEHTTYYSFVEIRAYTHKYVTQYSDATQSSVEPGTYKQAFLLKPPFPHPTDENRAGGNKNEDTADPTSTQYL